MYLFSIPDSYEIRNINKILLQCMGEHAEWFYDDFRIETTYGCPSFCIWNGNRSEEEVGIPSKISDLIDLLTFYSKHGIQYRLIFTNFCLEDKHLLDTYGNMIAKVTNDFGNSYVMISTDMMYQYMVKNYPNLKICWSTTTDFGKKVEDIIKKVNELSQAAMVVLPYELNNKKEYLFQLKYPENIEVLVNDKCIDNCPRRREHWALENKFNLLELSVSPPCFFADVNYNENTRKHHIVTRDALHRYSDNGIVHFKVEGRTNRDSVVESYKDYFIRQECWDLFDAYYKESKNKVIEIGEKLFVVKDDKK